MTLVSVVIPTYNSSRYLREAIESALAQTYSHIEIIVVDDGSTDDTGEVCKAFRDKVKYFYRANDGTRGNGARYRAVLEAQGEYIALLDHDDRWLPTKIEEQVALIERDTQVGIAFTGASIIDGDGRLTSEAFDTSPSGDVFHHLLAGARYCASSALVRRSAIDFVRKNSPDGDFVAGTQYWNNDTDLWMRISRHYRVTYLPQELTLYRYHGANDSRDLVRLWSTDMTMLETKKHYFHADCKACGHSLRRGMSKLRHRLALAHLDQFITKTSKRECAVGSLIAGLKAKPSIACDVRRSGVIVKYLARHGVNCLMRAAH